MRRFNSSVIRLKNGAGEYEGMVALRGYNSYELAKQMGFEGTEEEWMESLIGDGWIGAFQTIDQRCANLEAKATKRHTVTLLAANWVGDKAPYTQSIDIEGITVNDVPHWGLIYSAADEVRSAEKEAFAVVDDLETFGGYVVFTCFEDKPATDINIQMEVNR